MNTEQYFKNLKSDVDRVYLIAEEARSKNLDPKSKVEIPLAMSMAEKVVGLISTIYPQMMGAGIAERITELEKQWGKLDPAICLQIAEEVAKQKFCKFDSLIQAIDAGTRIAFAYITLGVVSSPIEGLTEVKIMKTREGKEYLSAYYSGPVRSAGGTGAAFSLVILDHLREVFGFVKYDPTEEEIKRTATELADYHERITNLQYMPTEEECLFLARNIPLQVNGEPSEKLEVSNYKNLSRIETNFIRGGFCLVIGEGLAQKAPKIQRYITSVREKGFKLTDWDFLKDYVELHKKRDTGKTDSSPTYIKDLVAGRPVFGHPSRSGAFRFRYGRGRTSGFSAASLHPATMAVTDDFIAIGTQLKIEKPTKGCAITSSDVVDGPIVKLFNGNVRKLKSLEEARKVYSDIEEIIYLGDILFPFSDLANRNHALIKPGYVEEWWHLDLAEKDLEFSKIINPFSVSLEEAADISLKYEIPLNPKFIIYWSEISKDQFLNLISWLSYSRISGKIILPFNKAEQEKFKEGKRALELLGLEHDLSLEHVIVGEPAAKILFSNLGLDFNLVSSRVDFFLSELFDKNLFEAAFTEDKSILEVVNSFSKFFIKDKSGDFIGTRMGRPEKAKLRKLTGSPNTLFPVGWEGGKLRSLNTACEKGFVKGDFPLYFCEKCSKETIFPSCETCGFPAKKQYYFYELGRKSSEKNISECEKEGSCYCSQNLDINYYLQTALKKLNMRREELPPLIKGIRGTSSDSHATEHLEKGILRAKYDLQVNKDGTVRFDATELPIVSFKPKEIGVSVKKLRELGYDLDIYDKELVDENQILELMPHDVLLPSCTDTPDERADDVFHKVCDFIDDLLVKFYGLQPFYNIKKKEDLIGHLGVCMAPHNCAGVVCRFIGFSNTLGLFASPFMHAAVRRDCDGDEAAIMLLGDVLLNFSREFLPGHRGGTQDAPLVLNAKIDAGEVDDQILDFEFIKDGHYPLEMYRLAETREHSSKVKIYNVKQILKEGKNPFVGFGFTHDTSNFNDGVLCSSYKTLATMQDKLKHQMELVEKIRAVTESDVARLVIERHFISDMRGNLRKFSMQGFRCVDCNEIMRRPPLSGVCPKCKGKIIFTIHEGGIRKYLDPALDLIKKYNLSPYIKQSVELTKEAIDSIFGKEIEKQEGLQKWF
ncbi:DNA polymerase II large subunit [uncultured archaeon]|nr:DNA polymerase II large subunit [uncultured archaeon]